MNLTSLSQVKSWCIENEFHPNRVLGQNFLIDLNQLRAIVDAGLGADDAHAANVLEVGPGLGVLTEEMLARGAAVTAIEKDPVLAGRLAGALGSPPRLKVIAGDALELASRPRADFALTGFTHMISNLPYQSGTRILLELAITRALPSMTALVQTEVAERLAAAEGSKTRSLSGVWVQLDYEVKIVRKVAASCFWPRPKVGSSVVKLIRHDRNVGLSDKERRFFRSLTKRAFEHRRKQLGSIFKDVIQSTQRAEELSNEEWLMLTKGLMENEDA